MEGSSSPILQIARKLTGSCAKMLQIAFDMGGSSSQMLQITYDMKSSSSKMLQRACSMVGNCLQNVANSMHHGTEVKEVAGRCMGRKTEWARKKITGTWEKIPQRVSAPQHSLMEEALRGRGVWSQPQKSGAMFYVRAGLPIQELAFLGRWRGNVVLICAKEALQEKPVQPS